VTYGYSYSASDIAIAEYVRGAGGIGGNQPFSWLPHHLLPLPPINCRGVTGVSYGGHIYAALLYAAWAASPRLHITVAFGRHFCGASACAAGMVRHGRAALFRNHSAL